MQRGRAIRTLSLVAEAQIDTIVIVENGRAISIIAEYMQPYDQVILPQVHNPTEMHQKTHSKIFIAALLVTAPKKR